MYDKLVAKANNIDTITRYILKTRHDTDSDLEKKIPDVIGLVQNTDYNALFKTQIIMLKLLK